LPANACKARVVDSDIVKSRNYCSPVCHFEDYGVYSSALLRGVK
jgi:hypothetical protein